MITIAANRMVAAGIGIALPVAAVVPGGRAHVRVRGMGGWIGGAHLAGTLHPDVLVQQRHCDLEHAQLPLDAVVTLGDPDRGIEQGQLLRRVREKLLRQDLA